MASEDSFFYAAVGLTSQTDCYSLTQHMVDLLNGLSFIDEASAFQVHARGQGGAQSFVFRRFTEDLDENRVEHEEPGLLDCVKRKAPVEVAVDGPRSRLVFPVESEAGPLRVLCVDGEEISPEERVFLLNLVTLYRNQANVLDAKERDSLTGLLNRHTFDLRMMQVTELRRGNGGTAWIGAMDIDHFKRINDTHGHLIGDEVLLQFAQLMERHFRHTDFLFRFGGEEFIVLLTLTDDLGAARALERFRSTVEGFDFPAVGKVTVSIGYARIETGTLPTTLVDWSDRALYYAKQNGRNRVVSFDRIRGGHTAGPVSKVELF